MVHIESNDQAAFELVASYLYKSVNAQFVVKSIIDSLLVNINENYCNYQQVGSLDNFNEFGFFITDTDAETAQSALLKVGMRYFVNLYGNKPTVYCVFKDDKDFIKIEFEGKQVIDYGNVTCCATNLGNIPTSVFIDNEFTFEIGENGTQTLSIHIDELSKLNGL